MPLPIPASATSTVSIDGQDVPIRSLSRTAALKMRDIAAEEGDAEAFVLSSATGESLEDAAKWLDSVDNAVAIPVIRAILVLSGLAEPDAPKAKGRAKP